jgi:hypothetical protein
MNLTRTLRASMFMGLLISPMASFAAMSFGLGPLGGMNFGDANIDGHDKTTMRKGFAAGLRTEFGVTSPISLMIEPTYVQKGADFEYAGGINASGELDYIEIPALIKAKFGAQKANAYAFAGPSLDINTSAKGSISTFSDTFEKQAANIVFSGQVGGGAEFQIAPYVYLAADIRYVYAFTDALEDNVGDISSWKSRDIRLTGGVLFHITE